MRLRFRAGLLRLDARELLEYRPSLTTGEVAEAIFSPAFDQVGANSTRSPTAGARPARPTRRRAAKAGSAC